MPVSPSAGGGNDLIIVEALERLHTHLHNLPPGGAQRICRRKPWSNTHAIALALKARDPDAAEAAMRAHIENSFERLIPFIND